MTRTEINECNRRATELLNDREAICNMPVAGPSDRAKLNGMIEMLQALGWDCFQRNGKWVVIDPFED